MLLWLLLLVPQHFGRSEVSRPYEFAPVPELCGDRTAQHPQLRRVDGAARGTMTLLSGS